MCNFADSTHGTMITNGAMHPHQRYGNVNCRSYVWSKTKETAMSFALCEYGVEKALTV